MTVLQCSKRLFLRIRCSDRRRCTGMHIYPFRRPELGGCSDSAAMFEKAVCALLLGQKHMRSYSCLPVSAPRARRMQRQCRNARKDCLCSFAWPEACVLHICPFRHSELVGCNDSAAMLENVVFAHSLDRSTCADMRFARFVAKS